MKERTRKTKLSDAQPTGLQNPAALQKPALRRTNMYFTAPQMDTLAALSASTGLSIAELVRRAVDAYLEARIVERR